MTQTRDLLTSLKHYLRAKGRTYRDVAAALDISEASVKRIFSEQSFSLHRLEDVCRYLDITFYDLARMARTDGKGEMTELTLAQERGLAKQPQVLTYFYLLLTGRTPAAIAGEFALDDLQQTKILVELNKLKLVELLPNNHARLLVGRRIHWRHSGPVRQLYKEQVQAAFMAADFAADDERLAFETGELSQSSVGVLLRKIEKLSRDFDALVELDFATPAAQKQAYGLMFGFRPWTFWQILESTANDMGLNADRSQARRR